MIEMRNFIERRIEITSFNKEEQVRYKDEVNIALGKIKVKMENERKKRQIREERAGEKEQIAKDRRRTAEGVQQRYTDRHKPMEPQPYQGKPANIDKSGSIVL